MDDEQLNGLITLADRVKADRSLLARLGGFAAPGWPVFEVTDGVGGAGLFSAMLGGHAGGLL